MRTNNLLKIILISCFIIFLIFFDQKDQKKEDLKMLPNQTCMNKYKEVNKDKFVLGRSVWVDEDGVKMICNLLYPNMRVLEYGSGGSTTMFSNFVHKWISIEHDTKWGEQMNTIIKNLNLQDIELF